MRIHTTTLLASLMAASLFLGAIQAARAIQYSYTTLTHDGAQIFPSGISNNGTIVGDEAIHQSGAGTSFVLGSTYVSVSPPDDKPDASYNTAYVSFHGINNAGLAVAVVDVYNVNGDVYFSHEWQNGAFLPKSPGFDQYEGINDNGVIVGFYTDSTNQATHGLINGALYDVPGYQNTRVYGINNHNRVVGTFVGPDGLQEGFYKDDGSAAPVVLSSESPLIPADLLANGINDYGDIVGYLAPANTGGAYGFLYRSDVGYTPINYPGARFTLPYGINNSGVIVGSYSDSNGAHGFKATPVPYTMDDLRELLNFVSGMDSLQGVADPGFFDVDHDGQVTMLDAAIIGRKIGGLDRNP